MFRETIDRLLCLKSLMYKLEHFEFFSSLGSCREIQKDDLKRDLKRDRRSLKLYDSESFFGHKVVDQIMITSTLQNQP